jgi:hypothetical protein
VVSASPILPGDVILPDDWFTSLREILELLAATLPTQTTFNAPAASQKIRAVFGSNTPTMPPAHLATVHGDLHWSNLTAFPLYIFDWEHCGAGLPAYDPAMLLMLALGNKKVSAQIEQYFDDWLQKTDGLWAQVYAAAEIMSRYSADPNFPALKPLLDQRVRSILPRLARRG